MNVFSGVVIYILIWWIVFFCMLPFGIQTIARPKTGAMPGAPVQPGLKRKLIITTSVAFLLWMIAFGIIRSDLVSFHDMALKMRM